MKAFRLNKYEKYGKVLTYFDLFVLYLAVRSLNCILNQKFLKMSYEKTCDSPFKDFQIKLIYTLYSHAYFTQPQTLVRIRFLFASDQLTQHKAHALSAEVFLS